MKITFSFFALGAVSVSAWAPLARRTRPSTRLFTLQEKETDYFFASRQATATTPRREQLRRVLGSQELLMLPRQYGPNPEVTFPQMNHVSVHILSSTPSEPALRAAITDALKAHPLLSAKVEGDGEPSKRIDLFQMVREGEPNPLTFVSPADITVDDVLTIIDVDNGELEASWQAAFGRDLDNGSWCAIDQGPLWRVAWHRALDSGRCALVLTFNHAISDQSSVNRLVDQLLQQVVAYEATGSVTPAQVQDMPLALEDSVLGIHQRWHDVKVKGIQPSTLGYVAGKAAEGLRSPVILPDGGEESWSSPFAALQIIAGRAPGGKEDTMYRRSTLQFRTLSKNLTTALLEQCRAHGVSMSNALTAAVTLTATDFIDGGVPKQLQRNYKVLQSLDMRRFGERLDKAETVACMAGSMDLMYGPLPDRSGYSIRSNPQDSSLFWKLAKEGKHQTEAFVRSGGPQNAVRVFDFAMSISDLNNLIHLTSQSKDTKGRAYSAGLTNVGVYERQKGFQMEGESTRQPLSIQHGKYKIEGVFCATSHTQSGCLYPASCQTVDGELHLTFHPAAPIVSEETNQSFANAFVDLLASIATGKATADGNEAKSSSLLPKNTLPLAAAVLGAVAVASHGEAWVHFFQSVAEMKANVDNPADFWAALNFWIFFAVGHPILQPILWISDVLHGTPGPEIADLVPVLFVAGNLVAIAAISLSKEIRNAVNIAAVAAFFAYTGAGLDGAAGLGDYNLGLDDSYQGQVVKGCPAYEDVRQPSMNDFDIEKYQGLWYEQKFHDWTQFKEVYDTTLGIKLTDGGKGWIDDFAVKGPAPDAAKLSWDKSPVANGAHYFLFGRVDEKDPPGILREKGFGVEFPNYIVDVKKDPLTGEYKEAIQFQCLERGGVRVFEGINFMSRNPTMTDEEMAAMHARAKQAGMYPYGASPEQMHTVARKLDDAPIDNNWQAMWRAIGLDNLLELLTESIEDGGR